MIFRNIKTMKKLSKQTLILLFLKSIIVNARYRSDIHNNIIPQGGYFTEKRRKFIIK